MLLSTRPEIQVWGSECPAACLPVGKVRDGAGLPGKYRDILGATGTSRLHRGARQLSHTRGLLGALPTPHRNV